MFIGKKNKSIEKKVNNIQKNCIHDCDRCLLSAFKDCRIAHLVVKNIREYEVKA